MGILFGRTLVVLATIVVTPALAEDFSFTKTLHSGWTGEGSVQVGIINNPEDDYIHVVNNKNNVDIFCHPKAKQATRAVFLCGKQEIEARYSEGTLYLNDAAYERVN